MKFTLGWLKEHLDTTASLKEITDKLTALGLELEGVEDPAALYAPFKVAKVISAQPHPDADRLQICMVDTGKEKVQVVCGAPNARTGMTAIFAPDGSYIPGLDTVLKKGKIRGQDSNGMLVSEREMKLSNEHNGIIDLPDSYAIGTPIADIFGLNDPVIDIAITPNRADCTGVRGIARDLAAAGLGTLKPLNIVPVPSTGTSKIGVTIADTTLCPQFLGRMITGVKNGTSPKWMQARLKAIGLRPISALVDITNYMTYDLCRPLHVFDADLVKGAICVRPAKKGEELSALNDKDYTLEDGMCAITDESGVIGLGGIVGGTTTACSETTANVFLECAYFTPLAIAKTGRTLQIDSDARYRFERGIDPAFTKDGIEIATRLIMEICGGTPSAIVSAGNEPAWKRSITFDPAYTKKLSGLDIPADKQVSILQSLGFTVNGNQVTLPSWRGDIEGKADLVEEIARVTGFDKIEAVSVRSEGTVFAGAETPHRTSVRQSRTALAVRGLKECITWSFMDKNIAALFGDVTPALTLSNPISSDWDYMRPTIIPNLMQAAVMNADKGNGDCKLFEVGPVFPSVKTNGQITTAAGVRYGIVGNRHWEGAHAARKNDVFDVKADALAAIEATGMNISSLQTQRLAAPYYHPGRSGALMMGNKKIAQFGEIHPAILDEMRIKGNVVAFEVFLQDIPAPKKKGTNKTLLQLSAFQPVVRDFAFIVDASVEAESLTKAAKMAERNLITDVSVFDVYQGKGVEEGKKSVALSVTFQPVKATLTDAEIESLCAKIIQAVADKTGAVLRG